MEIVPQQKWSVKSHQNVNNLPFRVARGSKAEMPLSKQKSLAMNDSEPYP